MKQLPKCSLCNMDLKIQIACNDNRNEWKKVKRVRPKFKNRELRVRNPYPMGRTQERVKGFRYKKEVHPSRYRLVLKCQRGTCRRIYEYLGRSKALVFRRMRRELAR
jgi:hypothetical protein